MSFRQYNQKDFKLLKNNWFYEYKLHRIYTVHDFFSFIRYYKSKIHEVNFSKNIKEQMSDRVFFVDRGYLSQSIQLDLSQKVNIKFDPSDSV